MPKFKSFTLIREFDCSYRKYDLLERKIETFLGKLRSDPIYYNKLLNISSGSFASRVVLKFASSINFSKEDLIILFDLYKLFPAYTNFMSTLYYIKYRLLTPWRTLPQKKTEKTGLAGA